MKPFTQFTHSRLRPTAREMRNCDQLKPGVAVGAAQLDTFVDRLSGQRLHVTYRILSVCQYHSGSDEVNEVIKRD